MNRCHWSYGSSAAGTPSTGITCKMEASDVKTSGVVCVTGQATMTGRLAAAVPVVLGLVLSTWFRRHAWMVTSLCAPSTRSWSTKWIVTLHGYAASGSSLSSSEAWLRRPMNTGRHPSGTLVVNTHLLCRPKVQLAWLSRHGWQPM
eukprot:3503295-Amphidinium_carterae.1